MWGRPQTDPGFGTICVFETICRVRLSCANNPFFGRKNRNGTKPTRIGALGGPGEPLKMIGSGRTEGGEGFKGAYIGGEGGTSSEDCLLSQSPAKEDSGSCWCSLLSGERWGGPRDVLPVRGSGSGGGGVASAVRRKLRSPLTVK